MNFSERSEVSIEMRFWKTCRQTREVSSLLAPLLLMATFGLPLIRSQPALARPTPRSQIASIQLERGGGKAHLKVVVRNPDVIWNGPFTIQVLGRPLPYCPWFPLRTWKHQSNLAPGHHLSLELFDDSNGLLKMLAVGPCQIRVRVSSSPKKSSDKPRLHGMAESQFPAPNL